MYAQRAEIPHGDRPWSMTSDVQWDIIQLEIYTHPPVLPSYPGQEL